MLDQLLKALKSSAQSEIWQTSFPMRGHNYRIKSELMRLSDTLRQRKTLDMSTQPFARITDLAAIERSHPHPLEALPETTARETQRCWKLRKIPR